LFAMVVFPSATEWSNDLIGEPASTCPLGEDSQGSSREPRRESMKFRRHRDASPSHPGL
jgi:hypothetical protein